MNDKALNEQFKKVSDAIDPLLASVDSKLLFSMFMGYSSGLSERLIAAGMLTSNEVLEMFAAACADATAPRTGAAPEVLYIDGDEKLGPKH